MKGTNGKTALDAIIDTWRMIEENNINNYKQIDSVTVVIDDEDFDRAYANAKNKRQIANLLRPSKANVDAGYRTSL